MRYMSTDEIRKAYLDFFVSKQHRLVPSDGLIPSKKDKSLLFTGAGMNQFKEMFLGLGNMEYTRATSSQKCFRTGDLDNVGRTAYHHTFFEMLGNFSFGDYFKKEAVEWAWEFLTKVLEIPQERLSASVYFEDEEAYAIWRDVIKLPEKRIKRFGAKDNFWPSDAPSKGPNGPCGPCSEIFFDQGPEFQCGPDCKEEACDCSRYCEVWNLVFTQFDRVGPNELKPLPRKNIDTGMGLERLVSVIQGVRTNFEIDIFRTLCGEIAALVGEKYPATDPDMNRRLRRIADHIRAATFVVCDGVLPANDGAGYVLKKLLRRAWLDGQDLGLNAAFLYKIVPVVADVMKAQYPELTQKRETIARVVKAEEEKFISALQRGSKIMERIITGLKSQKAKQLDGATAFMIYETYGYPLELIQKILAPEKITVDEKGFEEAMEKRNATSAFEADIFGRGPIADFKAKVSETPFLGYETMTVNGEKALLLVRETKGSDGKNVEEKVERASAKERVKVVLAASPFYGESGGQVGDTGVLSTQRAKLRVEEAHRDGKLIVHHCVVESGEISAGDAVIAQVNPERRNAIRRNHTATHLLHWALGEVLGEHVHQQGSKVAPDKFTFDYTHFEQPTSEELERMEKMVNERIVENSHVSTLETDVETAREKGAKALFGEKYGDVVRMVSVGDFSKELCGGTHVSASGEIGLFKILSDESLAAGVRRLTCATGTYAYDWVRDAEKKIKDLCAITGASPADISQKTAGLVAENKELRKELDRAKQKLIAGESADLAMKVLQVNNVNILVERISDADANSLRTATDILRGKLKTGVIFLGSVKDEKVSLICIVTEDLVKKGIKAGEFVGQAAKVVEGGGGGKPDMAQAGGKNPAKLDEALRLAKELITKAVESK